MSQFDGFGELINLDGNKSLLFYGRNNPVEDFNVTNRDVFGVLIDKSTGEFIGDEIQLTNRIGNKMIRPTTVPQSLEELFIEQAIAREAPKS